MDIGEYFDVKVKGFDIGIKKVEQGVYELWVNNWGWRYTVVNDTIIRPEYN